MAKIEAWTICLAYTFALAEKLNLPKKYWEPQAEITKAIIYNLLIDLLDELSLRDHFMEPHEVSDSPFYRPRITYCIALMSILGIWDRFYSNNPENNHEDKVTQFIMDHEDKLHLWGEAAIPQFLAYYWYLRCVDATTKPDMFLKAIIEGILNSNSPKGGTIQPLATPYYQVQDVVLHTLGLADNPIEDTFKGRSFMLEGLIHIFVRRNFKQMMRMLWPDATRLSLEEFQPDHQWQHYLWRSNNGTNRHCFPPLTKHWDELKEEAFECGGGSLPRIIRQFVPIYLVFLCVYPHRARPEAIRWIDAKIFEQI